MMIFMKKRVKWYVDDNYVEAEISETVYYCTGRGGYGLFIVDRAKNDRHQILGTAQFSVAGVKDKIGKMRRTLF